MIFMINNKPNIFEYATKELSQDAVFMYLFDCFNSDCNEERIIGKEFLNLIYQTQNKEIEKNINKLIIKKQYHNIDVLVLAEYEDGIVDAIIIEDKTYSSEHDNQLKRYYEDIVFNGIENKTINNVYGVYFRLGQPSIYEVKALIINDVFEYKIFNYELFLEFLRQYKNTNYLMRLICEFYEERLKDINIIDKADFSNPSGLDFDSVLSDGYSQDKYVSWLIKKVIGEYYPENQYSVMNFGQPCTQYRFVFTEEDEKNEEWDCVTKGNISKYCYFFRIDNNSKGWYIAINQYDDNGDKNWTEKSQVRDKIREQIREIIHMNGINDNTDNRGKKESKICLFNVSSFEEVNQIIPVLHKIYTKVIELAVEK